jgi:hypothetical protein
MPYVEIDTTYITHQNIMTTLDQLYIRIDALDKQMNLFNISISPPTKTELKRAISDKKSKDVVAVPIPYPQEELVEEPVDTDDNISDSNDNNIVETKTTNKKRVTGYTVFQRVLHDEAEQSIFDASIDTNITHAKPKQYMILKKLAAMWKEIDPDGKNLWNEEATKINANNNKV